jgi:glycosyltransferase involved in cell wall biosynthesis
MKTKDGVDFSEVCQKISIHFDDEFYRFSEEAKAMSLTPVEHYVRIGEKAGASPSKDFDPVFYAKQYPDVVQSGVNLFWHYVCFGKKEGRSAVGLTITLELARRDLRPDLSTIFLVLHDASRTGAPILGWNILRHLQDRYNVVTILLKGGPIRTAFDGIAAEVVELPDGVGKDPGIWMSIAEQLKTAYDPEYVIANSAATHALAVAFEAVDLPVIALVHEFASDMQPIGILSGLYSTASKIVFPAKVVEDNARGIYTDLRGRRTFIAPQGQSLIPPFSAEHNSPLPEHLTGSIGENKKPFTVVGVGTVTYRKGVDLFVSVADYIVNTLHRRDISFVWVGTHIPADAPYRSALQLQIQQCDLANYIEFVGEVDNLEDYLNASNLFFVSSRIDPLPNVGIDAALKGLPIVCFDGATGFAEFLKSDPATEGFVARYCDVREAGDIISAAASRADDLKIAGGAIKSLAISNFSMSTYVRTIERLAHEAIEERKTVEKDAETINGSGLFNKSFCLGPTFNHLDDKAAVKKYVDGSRRTWPLARHFTGTFIRRPMVGFNPLIYDLHVNAHSGTPREPFADFLDRGQPNGPWLHPVIYPGGGVPDKPLNVALHCHFHYPDALEEMLSCLAVNKIKPDLFITTTSASSAATVETLLANKGMSAEEIWIVQNLGRDIFCFLKDMPQKLRTGNYDIVGHVHGKKSVHVDSSIGDGWRNFMWQHLIGDKFPVIDNICDAFSKDSKLGLVFPEDPHLNGWDFNLEIARDLANRLGIDEPLPIHFDFPIGTMFWARPEALQPLFDMPLLTEEIPNEPVPIDGTILHALERIIPFAVEKAGFSYATTHVDGVWR